MSQLGSSAPAQIKAEITKVCTTNTLRWFLIGMVVVTAQGLLRTGASHHYDLYPRLTTMSAVDQAHALAQAAFAQTQAGRAAIAADMMTAGQFLGVLFAMLIGVLIVTDEFHHQIATATFMANPHRDAVIAAKIAAAAGFGALFWLVSTIVTGIVTPLYLRSQLVTISLTDRIVVRSVLLSLLLFAIWAVLGLGLGALIRSQIGAVVTGMAVYLVGYAAVAIVLNLIYQAYHHSWLVGAAIIAPAVASMVMTTPGRAFEHAPPQWAGLVVMVGYALLLGVIGAVVTRRLDVT